MFANKVTVNFYMFALIVCVMIICDICSTYIVARRLEECLGNLAQLNKTITKPKGLTHHMACMPQQGAQLQ